MIPGMSQPHESDVSLLLFFFLPLSGCGFLRNRGCVVLFAARS